MKRKNNVMTKIKKKHGFSFAGLLGSVDTIVTK